MKRSLSLIVLAAICVLALAAVTSLSGCSTKAPDNDPTGSIDSPDPAPAVTGGNDAQGRPTLKWNAVTGAATVISAMGAGKAAAAAIDEYIKGKEA